MHTGKVLIYGGRGALGSACVNLFRENNWWVASIDITKNDNADSNILITNMDSWTGQESEVVSGVGKALGTDKVDAIICVAGGWAGGKVSDPNFIKNCDLMVKQSLWSSGIAAKLASIFLKDDGLLSLTGAQASLSTTPGMIGYGFAKSAVHHLCKSLAADKSGISKSCTVVSILPITLDTPMNRAAMPNADKSTWTPLSFVADLFLRWTSDKATRPQSGSLVQLHTASGSTQLVMFT